MTRAWIAVLACTLFFSSNAQFPFLRSLEIRPGQQRPAITCIVQDSVGLLWTGSDIGLYRTDGGSVDVVLHSETGGVTALFPVGRSVLVALEGGILLRCSATECDTLLVDPDLAAAPIRAILGTSDGTILLATYGAGVWSIRGGSVTRITTREGLPDDHVNAMALSPDGRIVIGTDQGLAICTDGEVVEVFDEVRGAPDNLVLAVAVAGNGRVVAGTDRRGVFTWRPGSDSTSTLDPDWNYGQVVSVACQGNAIWAGTTGHGVLLYDGAQRDTRYRQPIADDERPNSTSLFVDQEGSVWWCDGSERIHRADPAILFVPEHEGIDMRSISALCTDDKDQLWFATPEGLFYHSARFSGAMRTTHVPLNVDPRTPIVSLAVLNGTIWVATFGSGVAAIDPKGNVRWFTETDGLSNNNVLGVRASIGTVWFATLQGVSIWNGHKFQLLPGTAGFTFDVLPLSDTSAYIATDGQGVLKWDHQVDTFNEDGPPTYYSLARTGDAVWAAGPGTGLCRVDGPRACYGKDRSPFTGDLFALGVAGGRVIIFGSSGTVAFDPISNAWTDQSSTFGLQGVQAQLNVISSGTDGALWFGSDRGLVRIDPEVHHFDPHVPLVITEVLISGQSKPVEPVLHTSFDRNDVVIRFAGLHYVDPGAVRFEYQVGAGAVQRTRDRAIALSDLAPGKHQFRIRAFVGEPEREDLWQIMEIQVDPPWWRTPLFNVSAVIGGTLLLFIILRARDRRIRYKDRMEQEKVRFQLDALRSQVDPHFLFNSFNTLVTLIETDTEKAVTHVDELSTFFRNILLVRDKELITVAEELELLRTYFGLEQRRFGAAIELSVRVPEEYRKYRMVPLTLQLLVENALKHNVGLIHTPLVVSLSVEDGSLVVMNPIRPRATPPRSTEFGLESIIKRYAALTKRAVVVDRTEGLFVVRIPLISAL